MTAEDETFTFLYILNDDNTWRPALKSEAAIAEAQLKDLARRQVARTDLGGVIISTAFLCHPGDITTGRTDPFETRVFGGPMDEYMFHYGTWQQAEVGHQMVVDMASLDAVPSQATLDRLAAGLKEIG